MRKVSGVIALLTALFIWFPSSARAQEKVPGPAMDVTGQAALTVPPNEAGVVFTVETSEARAALALEKNAVLADKVVQALKRAADTGADISTSNFTLQPIYERERDSGARSSSIVPKAYRVSNSIVVKTARPDTIGELIDAAVSAGATRVGSLSFSRSDLNELQKQTATMAIKNAMENAAALAHAAGLELKGITYVQFVPTMVQPGVREIALSESDVATPVVPGQIKIESYVNVTCELVR